MILLTHSIYIALGAVFTVILLYLLITRNSKKNIPFILANGIFLILIALNAAANAEPDPAFLQLTSSTGAALISLIYISMISYLESILKVKKLKEGLLLKATFIIYSLVIIFSGSYTHANSNLLNPTVISFFVLSIITVLYLYWIEKKSKKGKFVGNFIHPFSVFIIIPPLAQFLFTSNGLSFISFSGLFFIPAFLMLGIFELNRKSNYTKAKNRFMFSDIIEHSNNLFYCHTNEHELVYLSPQTKEFFGCEPEEAMIKWTELVTDNPINESGFQRTVKAIETGEIQEPYELELSGKNGEIIWVEVHEAPLIKKGKVEGIVGALIDITERKKVVQELLDSESKFKTLFENAGDAIFIMDMEKFIDCNSITLNMFRCKRSDIIGASPMDFSPKFQPDGTSSVESAMEKINAAREEKYVRFYWKHKRWDGTLLDVDVTLTYFDVQNKKYLQAIVKDITATKKAQDELRRREIQLRNISESLPGAIYQFYARDNEEYGFYYVSSRVEKIFGIPADKNTFFDNFLNQVPEEAKNDFIESVKCVIKEFRSWDYTFPFINPDGEKIWVRGNSVPYKNGSEIIFNGVLLDVTKQKEAEKALSESEAKYKGFFQNVPLGVFHFNNQGIITDCNDIFVKIIGSTRETLVGLNMIRDIRDQKMIKAIKMSLEKGEGYYEDYYESVTSEKSTPVRVIFKGIPDENGNIKSGLAIIEDITQRKNAENEIRENEKRFRDLAELLPEGVFETDQNLFITYVNSKAMKMFGYEKPDLDQSLYGIDMFAVEDRKKVIKNFYRKLRGDDLGSVEYMALKKNGEKFPVLFHSHLVVKNGKFQGMKGIIVDISLQKNVEKDLKVAKYRAEESNRLKTAFLNNMSHEIRTPLNVIMGYAGMLNDEYISKDDLKDFTEPIVRNSHQLHKIIEDIIDISRIETGQVSINTKDVNINEVVLQTIKALKLRADHKGIELSFPNKLDETNSIVITDEYKIQQVLTNLVSNAINYTEKGYVRLSVEFVGRDIQFLVEDSGVGIEKENYDRIFERFQRQEAITSREYESRTHGGTGLGLPICKGLIELLGGEIWVESELGKGSKFYFTIPFISKR